MEDVPSRELMKINHDKCLGYINEECKNCGRQRVELWESGVKVCEKCNWDQDKEEYDFDFDY